MRSVLEQGVDFVIRLYDTGRHEKRSLDWSLVLDRDRFVSIEALDYHPPHINSSGLAGLAKRVYEVWRANHAVGIHCGMGIGRTGTMALMLLAELIRKAGS